MISAWYLFTLFLFPQLLDKLVAVNRRAGHQDSLDNAVRRHAAKTSAPAIPNGSRINGRQCQHYRKLTVKQSFDIENTLLDGSNIIDFPTNPRDLSRYDEVLYQ